jgi:hypothetical protein
MVGAFAILAATADFDFWTTLGILFFWTFDLVGVLRSFFGDFISVIDWSMRNSFLFVPFGTTCIRLIDGITRSTSGIMVHCMNSDGGATAVPMLATQFSLRLYGLIFAGLVGFLFTNSSMSSMA